MGSNLLILIYRGTKPELKLQTKPAIPISPYSPLLKNDNAKLDMELVQTVAHELNYHESLQGYAYLRSFEGKEPNLVYVLLEKGKSHAPSTSHPTNV